MKYHFSIRYKVFKKYQVFYLNGDSILQLTRDFLIQNFQDSVQFLNLQRGILDVRFKFANNVHP